MSDQSPTTPLQAPAPFASARCGGRETPGCGMSPWPKPQAKALFLPTQLLGLPCLRSAGSAAAASPGSVYCPSAFRNDGRRHPDREGIATFGIHTAGHASAYLTSQAAEYSFELGVQVKPTVGLFDCDCGVLGIIATRPPNNLPTLRQLNDWRRQRAGVGGNDLGSQFIIRDQGFKHSPH